MSLYSGVRRSITPNTSNDNWALDAASSESGKVIEVYWGGEATTSTAMQTRVARSASGTTPTAGTPAKIHPNSATNLITFATGWSGQPTLDGNDLFSVSWNA